MMAAYRLKGLGWFGSVVVVSLGFYLVSLQVAQERKKLDDTNHSIAQANRDLRALETEFQTRANLAQLEKWNGDVLALTSPVPSQYLSGESALASIDFRQDQPQTQMASLIVPSAPMQPTPAVVTTPAPSAEAVPAATLRDAVETRSASVDHAKTQAVAMLDRKLLSDSTLGDLLSGARTETSRLR